ncbi:hypothetical protein EDB85DRAFT_1251179 [Lactarius pseudohatsudake]|nr:hypothetical protein EDB85DRAFT_1251179 [Lactarius pseudohatsudake]
MFPAYQLSFSFFLRIVCTRIFLRCADAALLNIFFSIYFTAAATAARHVKNAPKDRMVAQNVIRVASLFRRKRRRRHSPTSPMTCTPQTGDATPRNNSKPRSVRINHPPEKCCSGPELRLRDRAVFIGG